MPYREADAIRLIVNADDFGRAPGVSRGIVAAYRHGIVTSTTLMANLPWAAEAVELAHTSPDLGLGLHLSFCYGPPLAAAVDSLLGPDGRLNRDLIALAAAARPEDIYREARAQLMRFMDLTSRLPSHLDSHLHVHSWPACREPLLALAREYSIPIRPATSELAAALRQAGIPAPDRFVDAFFTPGTMTLPALLDVLRNLQPGITELMVHPGYDDSELADSSFRAQREQELALLCSADVREVIAHRRIQLVTYDDVTREKTVRR